MPASSSGLRPLHHPALLTLLTLALLACSHDGRESAREDAGRSKPRDAVSDEPRRSTPPPPALDECAEDNPYCREPTESEQSSCGSELFDLAPAGVNVMIAIDGSSSMASHWPRVRDAIAKLRENNREAAFGLHVFWGELADLSPAREKANFCGTTQNRVLDVAARSADELLSFLGDAPPGPGGVFWDTSPVIEPLNYYLSHDSALADPTRTNYLVLISDGNDNCFGSFYANQADKLLAFEKLAVELGKKKIRVLPVGFDAASGMGNPLLPGYDTSNTNRAALDTLAKFGGSGVSEALAVDDPEELERAIEQVGKQVASCRFVVPEALADASPFALGFTIAGQEVPRDRTHKTGWDFIAGDTGQVELYGKPCEALRAGARITVSESCNRDVCGTATLEVSTKPRAVLHVVDASAARIECVNGSVDCLVWLGPNAPRTLTFWETVEHAVGKSIIAPINDDVEFGLQLFPAKSAAQLSCEVAPEPEVAPAPGTAITILSQMLEKLPFGRKPLVSVLESIANHPGRLADPSVSGAVVVLSDGGDDCTEDDPALSVERLRKAATSLRERGVKTYVVRFGLPREEPELERQLRAIVEAAGTAELDPANENARPYVDAIDEEQLNAALARVSDRLASCSFELGALDVDADPSRANLYMNGVVVPRDTAGTRAEGWSFRAADAKVIDLYGKACAAFKTNRKTSIHLEFGCAVVTVI